MKFDPAIFSPENSWFIGELSLSYLLLNFDQSYLGRTILVPKHEEPDFESMKDDAIGALMREVAFVGRLLKEEFAADRMNYASLGNVVGQLHWHIIPRYEQDANWGGPPWPIATPVEPTPEQRVQIIQRIRNRLPIDLLN